MRKFVAGILALVYISTSTGVMLNMHYCMGKLADWELGHNNSGICSGCGMEKSSEKDNGCCKDEQKFIKNNTDQKTVEPGFQLIQVISVALPVSVIAIPSSDFYSVTEENSVSHAPPRSYGVAVYIRNCVFLI